MYIFIDKFIKPNTMYLLTPQKVCVRCTFIDENDKDIITKTL